MNSFFMNPKFVFIRHTLCVLFLFLSLAHSSAQPLADRLQRLMTDPLLTRSEVGITVYDLTEGKSVFTYQDKKLYRPASVEKLITGITALSRLGLDYRINTELFCTGDVVNGVLHGDLYVRGNFDSEFDESDMQTLVGCVRAAGIRQIMGTVVGDVSMKDSLYYGDGWSWDDARFDFQPCLSPLMYNKGCVRVVVRPTQRDSLAQVTVSPHSSYYTVSNKTRCYDSSVGKLSISRDWLYQSNEIGVCGNVTRTVVKNLPLFGSEHFFLDVFTERLRQAGITMGLYGLGVVPPDARRLGEVSRPITEVLHQAMKKSDNLSAEALFYNLARSLSPYRPATAADGVDVIESQIAALGYDPSQYNIADGSGVSLYNYISPDLLLGFLVYAYHQKPLFEVLYESLPIAGVDGTLSARMNKTKACRRVHAKTGTVTGVSSLAGYALASNGHMMAFVIINQNILKGSQARAFQNKICVELCK